MRVSTAAADPLEGGVAETGTEGSTASGWETRLLETISDRSSPVHLVGVGNELRADDAAGLEIVAGIRSTLGSSPAPGIKVHGGSAAPERLLSKLAAEKGRIVIFDAVETSGGPGDVVFRGMADTKYGFFGTHNIPLRLVPGLPDRLDDVFLVGIQPASLDVGSGLSHEVRASVARVLDVVTRGIKERA